MKFYILYDILQEQVKETSWSRDEILSVVGELAMRGIEVRTEYLIIPVEAPGDPCRYPDEDTEEVYVKETVIQDQEEYDINDTVEYKGDIYRVVATNTLLGTVDLEGFHNPAQRILGVSFVDPELSYTIVF